jgi:hypothetical protein
MTPRGQSAGSRRVRPLVTRTGPWGLSFSEFRPSSPGTRARIGHRPRRDPPSSIRRPGPHRPPLVLVRADPPVRTLGRRLGSQSLPAARQVRGCRRPPLLPHRYGKSWLAAFWPGCPPDRPRGLEVLAAEEPRSLRLPGAAQRPRLFSRFGLVLPGRASPVILALFRRRSPWFPLREVGPWLRHPSYHLIR